MCFRMHTSLGMFTVRKYIHWHLKSCEICLALLGDILSKCCVIHVLLFQQTGQNYFQITKIGIKYEHVQLHFKDSMFKTIRNTLFHISFNQIRKESSREQKTSQWLKQVYSWCLRKIWKLLYFKFTEQSNLIWLKCIFLTFISLSSTCRKWKYLLNQW